MIRVAFIDRVGHRFFVEADSEAQAQDAVETCRPFCTCYLHFAKPAVLDPHGVELENEP